MFYCLPLLASLVISSIAVVLWYLWVLGRAPRDMWLNCLNINPVTRTLHPSVAGRDLAELMVHEVAAVNYLYLRSWPPCMLLIRLTAVIVQVHIVFESVV